MEEYSQPILSICIPTLNRAEILRQTLTHLADTLDPSFEIVVSDNCSSDHTIDVLDDFARKWKRFRYITQPKELFVIKSLAAAMLMGRGRYLYCFSDDVRLFIEGISKAVRLMEERSDIAGVFGSYKEWDPYKNEILMQFSLVDNTKVFPKGSKSEIFQQFAHLWFPVIKNEIFQRFCVHTYDGHSFGLWPLVSRILDHGAIAIIPDFFYKHAHTKSRMEQNITEGWFHDMNRAQYEIYLGEMELGSPDNATLVSNRVSEVYLHGVRFSIAKKEWLTGRIFLLRARAYGLVKDEFLLAWEHDYLVEMSAERLKGLISFAPDIHRIIIEEHTIADDVCAALKIMLPETDICVIDRESLFNHHTKSDEFIIAWDYETLRERAFRFKSDPLRQCSLEDIFGSCRLTQVPVDFA